MAREEKQLLLKVLCAMLPYGLVVNIGGKDLKLDRQHQGIGILYPEDCSDEFNERNNNSAFYITISGCYYGEDIKPYLRSMSSMTEEEEAFVYNGHIEFWVREDYCNKHFLDYRGLIPIGLAIEAPDGMYELK